MFLKALKIIGLIALMVGIIYGACFILSISLPVTTWWSAANFITAIGGGVVAISTTGVILAKITG